MVTEGRKYGLAGQSDGTAVQSGSEACQANNVPLTGDHGKPAEHHGEPGEQTQYDLRQYWNGVASQIASRRAEGFLAGDNTPFTRYLRQRFLEQFRAIGLGGLSVCEIGCGPGGNLQEASLQRPARLIGCDVADKMLARARANLASVRVPTVLIQTDGKTLPLPSRTLDVCFTVTVLQHVTDTRIFASILSEIFRVCRRTVYLFEDTFPIRWPKYSHTARPVREYDAAAGKSGFRLTETEFPSTAFSDVACSTVRRVTSSPWRPEGKPVPALTEALQSAVLRGTRYLDRWFPVNVGLTKLRFERNPD